MNIEELINKNKLLEDENKILKEKLKNYTALPPRSLRTKWSVDSFCTL
jgi:hypothetical protein